MSLLGKLITAVLAILLVAVVFSFMMVLLGTYREYEGFRERERRTAERLEALRRERDHKEEYLRLVLEDPDFLERVVRERLGYIKPDETIFLFEEHR